MCKERNSVSVEQIQDGRGTKGEGVNISYSGNGVLPCHPEMAEKSIEHSEIRFLPCSGSQKTAPSPAFQAPSPVGRGKRAAFTLAEVLITLGIIGVVAAMTLPTLIQNYKKQEVETKLAKVYSVMNQAIKMAEVEYGDPSGWKLDCMETTPPTCTVEESKEWFMKYIGKNLKKIKIESTPSGKGYRVYFSDGTIMGADSSGEDFRVYLNKKAVDNGIRGVNDFQFRFAPSKDDERNNNKYHVGKGFEPYSWGWDGTKDGLMNNTYGYGCAQENAIYCTKLIQLNGWKIPKDYPFKF